MLTETMAVNLPRSIVTDHYLLDQYGKVGRKAHAVGPANNCQFRMILKIILKKKAASYKQQASSLTAGEGCYRMHLERRNI